MDAARSFLEFDGQFVVHDLDVKDVYAVADVEPYPEGSGEHAALGFVSTAGIWECVGDLSMLTATGLPPGETFQYQASPSLARPNSDYEDVLAGMKAEIAQLEAQQKAEDARRTREEEARVRQEQRDWEDYCLAYEAAYAQAKSRLANIKASRGLGPVTEYEVDELMREWGFTVKP